MIFKTEGLNVQEAFDDTGKLFFRSAGPVSLPQEPSGRAVPRLFPAHTPYDFQHSGSTMVEFNDWL